MQYLNNSKKITYVTSTYKTVLPSSLLTIFASSQKEQYLRLLSCYTTATFNAPVCQQWRLSSYTVAVWTHLWKRYRNCQAPRPHKDYMLLATVLVLPAAIDYTRTVLIPGWIHQLLSLHTNKLKIGKFSPIVATHCWPLSCQQAFKPAVA